MASDQLRAVGTRRAGNGLIRLSPAAVGALAVAVAAAVEGVLRCLRRTSRLAGEVRELTILSGIDPLTGLYNRRHVEEHLAAAVSAARRHHHSLSLLFIDIDSFKRINDRLGYEAGDEVLRAVGHRVSLAVRAEDLVGRWGGEEFLVVLPTTDLPGAVAVAERLRAAVACEAIRIDDREIYATVSVGCASSRGDPADLIRQASRALREAKQAGKNRVVAADAASD